MTVKNSKTPLNPLKYIGSCQLNKAAQQQPANLNSKQSYANFLRRKFNFADVQYNSPYNQGQPSDEERALIAMEAAAVFKAANQVEKIAAQAKNKYLQLMEKMTKTPKMASEIANLPKN